MRLTAVACAIVIVWATLAFAAGEKNISSREAKGLLSKGKNVFLLDVRTPDEYRQAHLRGAVLIPVNEIERRLREVPKNRPVVVYCAVGSRSGMVAGYLAGKGYSEVYNMSDGIVGWYRSGFSIEH
ncbi:rhodanese-like domain-containing protein [Geotalea toluenoxydans]|uniref:rhodanese-like domain-containing protein n=1 Tax=Geotalea toluenoxydans TaxID=421624 RepID=UPI0006D271AF|nr:rhodanese-like domain-containing protein [Geotalea toluenoxydans]